MGSTSALVEYYQPLLGIEQVDTTIKATLLIMPRVEMESISRSRFLDLIAAIYRKHYVEWYSIYPDTASQYRQRVDEMLAALEKRLPGRSEIQLRRPDRDFTDDLISKEPPLRDALSYLAKLVASGFAAAGFQILLHHYMAFPISLMIGIPASVFILLAVTVSLTDRKRFEAFKLLVSLVTNFFNR